MNPAIAESSKTPPADLGVQEPGRVMRQLRGDIDNIVLKALRKEPTRRYASVELLAEDIRRHLQGLPVMATPDSASYRVGKFVRRHRAGVGATAGLISMLFVFAVVMAVLAGRIARERILEGRDAL